MEPEKPEKPEADKDTNAEKAPERPLENVVDKGNEKTVEKESKPSESKHEKPGKGEKIGVHDPIVIAFINGKSGGQQGENVKKMLKQYLPAEQVYDLSDGGPATGYERKRWREVEV
jgi:hypothetical protein